MPLKSVDDIKLKDRIRFVSKDPYDNHLWDAKVVGMTDYEAIRGRNDLLPTHRKIAQEDANLPDITDLTFFTLSLSGSDQRVPYAKEWIDAATLTINDQDTNINIVLYDVAPDMADDALDLLRANGFRCGLKK